MHRFTHRFLSAIPTRSQKLLRAGFAAVIILIASADVSLSDQELIAKPSRIVSTHLCTDQLLLLLSDHDRIASLSFFSHNPDMSAMSETARNFPVNHGFAEEIVALDPDLILTSTFGHSSILLLERLGYQVRTIPVAGSLDDITSNIRLVADAIGESARGNAMATEFADRINTVRQQEVKIRPLLAIYNQNGFTFRKKRTHHATGRNSGLSKPRCGTRTRNRSASATGTPAHPPA